MPKRHFSLAIKFSILFLTAFTIPAFAKDATVFDVRRPIAMDNDEKPPKDFYINAGSNDGLKSGMIVTVQRRQSLYDPYQNKSPGDLVVVVGQLRLIHVQPDISVARLENIEGRQNLPTIEFEAIMVGDKVDLNSAKMAPRKTAALEVDLLPIQLLKTTEGSQDSASVAPVTALPAPTTSVTN